MYIVVIKEKTLQLSPIKAGKLASFNQKGKSNIDKRINFVYSRVDKYAYR